MPAATFTLRDEETWPETACAKRGCCLWMSWFGHSKSPSTSDDESIWWKRMRAAEKRDTWRQRGWNKVREWSELAATPKWKTLRRQFNKRPKDKLRKFQYDALSYSLNFDEWHMQNGYLEDQDCFHHDRYASNSGPAKSKMDVSKDDDPGLM